VIIYIYQIGISMYFFAFLTYVFLFILFTFPDFCGSLFNINYNDFVLDKVIEQYRKAFIRLLYHDVVQNSLRLDMTPACHIFVIVCERSFFFFPKYTARRGEKQQGLLEEWLQRRLHRARCENFVLIPKILTGPVIVYEC